MFEVYLSHEAEKIYLKANPKTTRLLDHCFKNLGSGKRDQVTPYPLDRFHGGSHDKKPQDIQFSMALTLSTPSLSFTTLSHVAA